MALIGLGIAAALGVAKSELVDKPAAEKQRQLAAATQKYSPWTGLKANPVQEANPFASAMQYGATGAQIGSNMKVANAAAANPNVGTNLGADSLTLPNVGDGALGVAQSNPYSIGAGQGSGYSYVPGTSFANAYTGSKFW